jgi:hypothetical protein
VKNNTLLYVAAAFAAGYYANKLYSTPSEAANVGASWNCLKNPNGPGCKGGNIHTVITPFPAKASWNCLKNPDAPGCQGGNIFKNGQPRVAGL